MTLCEMIFMYTIIKMPDLLVLSVNNIYTGLTRANIRYGMNGVRETSLMEGGYFLNREGGKYYLTTLHRKVDS